MFEIVCGLMVRAGNRWDRDTVQEVVLENRYRLPSEFLPDEIVLDIGAHVGSFAHACLTRGAGRVYVFEPDKDNIRICSANLKRYSGKTSLYRAAMWRSDTSEQNVNYTGPTKTPHGLNYGGGNVVFEDGLQIPVRCESLDSILSNLRRVRLMKLNCESSEWPILFTCKLLECVDEIVGEYHEIGGGRNSATIPAKASLSDYTSYTVDDLIAFLSRHGFRVEISKCHESNIGSFFAVRENCGLT